MRYYERHSIIKMTLTHMASTEAYIITSTILGLDFIAKNVFLHGETEIKNDSATLLVQSVTIQSYPYSAFAG